MDNNRKLMMVDMYNNGKHIIVIYLPPHQTHRTETPSLQQHIPSNYRKPTATLYFENGGFIHIANAKERQWTTIHACIESTTITWLNGETTLPDNPPLQLPSDTTTFTVHLHHTHSAHTAASTLRTGQLLQPDSQVQPTHAPINTDSKAT
jgi:hypothetical protein